MNIIINQLIEGARNAKGLTVIIDVFRAFSTACYVYNNNASKIIPVGSLDEAYRLKAENESFILMGERYERKCDGFDFGNSPTHIIDYDFCGKTVVHTTSSGTQGIVNAVNASEIITGSFVNAGAIIEYVKQRNPADVSLVCMGYSTERPSQEDTFCAEYIKSQLLNEPFCFDEKVEILRTGDGARLLDPINNEWSPSTDFDLCLSLNRFNFVLKIENDEIPFLRKIVV